MNNARLLRLHVDDASTALRNANHATFRETVTVTDAYDVVGSAAELVHRFPQLLGYLARSIGRTPGRYYDDRGRDPADAIRDAVTALDAATGGIDLVAVHLTTAHNALGHLGLDHSED